MITSIEHLPLGSSEFQTFLTTCFQFNLYDFLHLLRKSKYLFRFRDCPQPNAFTLLMQRYTVSVPDLFHTTLQWSTGGQEALKLYDFVKSQITVEDMLQIVTACFYTRKLYVCAQLQLLRPDLFPDMSVRKTSDSCHVTFYVNKG